MLKPLDKPISCGCVNCGSKPVRLNLNHNHHPGFGCTFLKKDGKTVFSDVHGTKLSYGRYIEKLAAADPDHDWRFVVDGPLYGMIYQRHGDKKWMAVERNNGFA